MLFPVLRITGSQVPGPGPGPIVGVLSSGAGGPPVPPLVARKEMSCSFRVFRLFFAILRDKDNFPPRPSPIRPPVLFHVLGILDMVPYPVPGTQYRYPIPDTSYLEPFATNRLHFRWLSNNVRDEIRVCGLFATGTRIW